MLSHSAFPHHVLYHTPHLDSLTSSPHQMRINQLDAVTRFVADRLGDTARHTTSRARLEQGAANKALRAVALLAMI